jgi:hypothetical protein
LIVLAVTVALSAADVLAGEAGYASVEVLPVENDFLRLYRLHP